MSDSKLEQLGECPDPGLIAAYVDGRLSESERDALHRHLALCDSCTELVAEVVAANEAALGSGAAPTASEQPAAKSPVLLFRRHHIVVAGAPLAAAAALALVVRVVLP